MRLCPVKDLEQGMILGKSLYQGSNQLILGAGFRITTYVIQKLHEKGYSHVYIMEEGTEDVIPEDLITSEVRLQATSSVADASDKIEKSFQFRDMSRSKIIDSLERGNLKDLNIAYNIRKVIEDIISEISQVGARFLNTMMLKSTDSYFVDHSLNTAVLAIIIGKQYKFNATELKTLATGCFLHDIGKMILEKMPGGEDESNPAGLYREHPTFGYLILKNDSYVSPMETQIVNQHHENQDGSGFPICLRGRNLPPVRSNSQETKGFIFRLAEICTVANAYDKLVLNPNGGEKQQPQDVLKTMMEGAGTIYNKDIVQTLSQIVAVYPVGSYVKIISIVDPSLIGSFGVVAKVNKENLSKPIIIITTNKYKKKIKPIMLDTSKLKQVELELVI